ncbi:MAG TPA: energy-coupling factor ABC transporter permease [Candidatus Omnitrophota bacterium]|nr:energy-coupling factor ABC transporter permease [Candidatus Omnitrophota bacterium]
MHIPDGFLSTGTWVTTWLISAGGLGACIRQASRSLKDKVVPLMGVMSAFVFAAQMLNFPVAGGTSGHFLGGVLAAVLLGPCAGAIVIAVVLMVQCLIFQDGGLTALGANIFNMSFIGTIGGYLIYRLCNGVFGRRFIIASIAVASWASVILASSACSLQLVISGTSAFNVVFPAMLGVHALIGIGEAVITCLVVSFVIKVRPDLVYKSEGSHE